MTDNRTDDPFTERMTHALRDDGFAGELRKQMEASLRPAAERVVADAVRPWRKLTFWMGATIAVLIIASTVQYWVR